ncbi:hypothetical protein [Enterovibrio norvegicus]|uniref:hypothetical protein n=1 Tax=Enterovibrio norvegicus TaxID=188144 RepID=UPI0003673D91|nr:hypothetical protein [Enterovibrio norvegicus]
MMLKNIIQLIEKSKEYWLKDLTGFYGKEYGLGWTSVGFSNESALKSALYQQEKQDA